MPMVNGCYVAVVTPFNDDFSINYEKLGELVEKHVQWGTTGLVPMGTTGECATVSEQEHKDIVKFVVEKAAGRLKVFAGTGTNATHTTVEMTQFAKDIGADGAMLVVPYYNKPTEDGLMYHFQAADKVGLPLMVYNVPGRTGINITPDFFGKLVRNTNNIVSLKEASGNLEQVMEMVKATPEDFSVMSGDDSLTLPILSVGGVGIVSVIGNFAPYAMLDMIDLFNQGKVEAARKIYLGIATLSKALLTYGASPAPVKYAMNKLGLDVGIPRPPIVAMSQERQLALDKLLDDAKEFINISFDKRTAHPDFKS